MKTQYTTITNFLFILFFSSSVYSQCFNAVQCGYYQTVAKKTDGTFWRWSGNNWGEIGNNGINQYESSPAISLSNNIQYLIAGGLRTFVIKTNGTLWGTGGNIFGTLGVNSVQNGIFNFTQVGTANNWKNVSSTLYFTIAMKTNNNIWGWGQNDGYQMGNNTCCADQLSPIIISTDTDWKSIAASGSRCAFAIKNNGTLWCWGTNSGYLLSSNLDRKVPTQHNPDTNWDKMSLGQSHILILKTNGTLWSWGNGSYGETADGLPSLYARDIPLQIGTANNWNSVAAGYSTSFGIKTDGTLWVWGRNDEGQLGIGNTVNQLFPVQLGTANNWAMVSTGYNFTVAVRTDGSLWSWGINFYGQLGNGTTTDDFNPANVPIAGCALANEAFEQGNIGLKISPNPAQGSLNIQYKGKQNVNKIIIYDLVGKQVYSTNALGNNNFATNFDISQLQTGCYIVTLKNDDAVVVEQKLIIE